MTTYSVLPKGSKHLIIATWPGAWFDVAARVTALDTGDLARHLVPLLTQWSEAAWDAAVWTADGFDVVASATGSVVAALRAADDSLLAELPAAVAAALAPSRHAITRSLRRLQDVVDDELLGLIGELTRPQRLTVADELAEDGACRDQLRALALAPPAVTPDLHDESRLWQAGDVTRALRLGDPRVDVLPDCSATWLESLLGRAWQPATFFAVRRQIMRIEQLVAAAVASGGRARDDRDLDMHHAHLVIPTGRAPHDSDVYKVTPGRVDPATGTADVPPMTVSRRDRDVLAQLEAEDTAGFRRVLGPWVDDAVPMPA